MLRRFARRVRKTKPRRGRKGARRGHGRRSPNTATAGSGQMAKIVETLELNDLAPNTAYSNVFSLAQFPRACTLAGSFQFYKAAKVTYSYEPLFNTFQENFTAGSSYSKPYMYTLMNRVQNSKYVALANLQACGAKPKSLVGKHTISYKPNWCSPGLLATTVRVDPNTPQTLTDITLIQQGLKAQYGWLGTSGIAPRIHDTTPGSQPTVPAIGPESTVPINPGVDTRPNQLQVYNNSVVYNGHTLWIDQKQTPDDTLICRLTVTVEWHFKGAVFNDTITPAPE